ncbi:type I-E CRISPR-associated protein Cas6/Cse3/CasE [Bradymonas sediminis]|nr:type I-E CRISPR-associated protein Cas6/Cse3/CasE [Bradymonas sediminis]TDP77376.1 CRISPR system Cascade subunit CasE [Bradymonas sediminis]
MTDSKTLGAPLYMVQFWFSTRRLAELARALRLPLRHADTSYMVHCALGELFGTNAPGLYYVDVQHGPKKVDDGRDVRVLAYSELPGDALMELARGFASPMVYATCDFERMAAKPMPSHFAPGMRLGFELRACPVIRKASAGESPSGRRKWRRGQELDAFVARSWELDDPEVDLEREAVYREWLTGHFERSGAVRTRRISLERFSLDRFLRRHGPQASGKRKASTITRPAATFSGELEVLDAAQFGELLRRGIGRHKSFGFGMLKIRRA